MFQLSFCSVSDFHNSKHNTNSRLDEGPSMLLIEIIHGSKKVYALSSPCAASELSDLVLLQKQYHH
jgi:hypothetical protein